MYRCCLVLVSGQVFKADKSKDVQHAGLVDLINERSSQVAHCTTCDTFSQRRRRQMISGRRSLGVATYCVLSLSIPGGHDVGRPAHDGR